MLQLLPCKLLLIVDSMMVTDIDGSKAPMMRSHVHSLSFNMPGRLVSLHLHIYFILNIFSHADAWSCLHLSPYVRQLVPKAKLPARTLNGLGWHSADAKHKTQFSSVTGFHKLSHVQIVSTYSLQVLRHRNNT